MYHRTTFQYHTVFNAFADSITIARPSLIFVSWVLGDKKENC